MSKENFPSDELSLYSTMFRCEACSTFTAIDGVAPFAQRGENQTIPVSHFGRIGQSALWLILNNPKGDRNDLAVNTRPSEFGVTTRAGLQDSHVVAIRERYDSYFQTTSNVNQFFAPWKRLLDGLRFQGKILSFASGLISAVDLIKCPTKTSWGSYVRTDEGKDVWDNCLRREAGNRYLLRQIAMHRPKILVFAGTAACVTREQRGSSDRAMNEIVRESGSALIKKVWSSAQNERISIGLGAQRLIATLKDEDIDKERVHLQEVIGACSMS